LRGEISGLKNNSQSGHMLLDHDKESK